MFIYRIVPVERSSKIVNISRSNISKLEGTRMLKTLLFGYIRCNIIKSEINKEVKYARRVPN